MLLPNTFRPITVNDGAFGAEWSRFAQVAFTEGGATDQELDREFDDDWIRATEELAQEQCGFPAMEALLAALTPECFTPISPSGDRGEQQCTNKPDPR